MTEQRDETFFNPEKHSQLQGKKLGADEAKMKVRGLSPQQSEEIHRSFFGEALKPLPKSAFTGRNMGTPTPFDATRGDLSKHAGDLDEDQRKERYTGVVGKDDESAWNRFIRNVKQ